MCGGVEAVNSVRVAVGEGKVVTAESAEVAGGVVEVVDHLFGEVRVEERGSTSKQARVKEMADHRRLARS